MKLNSVHIIDSSTGERVFYLWTGKKLVKKTLSDSNYREQLSALHDITWSSSKEDMIQFGLNDLESKKNKEVLRHQKAMSKIESAKEKLTREKQYGI